MKLPIFHVWITPHIFFVFVFCFLTSYLVFLLPSMDVYETERPNLDLNERMNVTNVQFNQPSIIFFATQTLDYERA